MSRHSHWAKIKRSKGDADAKKGQVFTKLARQIVVAVKEKGADPVMNFKLRLVMDAARAANMPKENIERAIARASGKGEEGEIFEVTYEAIGPGGVAMMIDAVTDNKNRTSGNVKTILSRYGGSLAGAGAVAWQFDRKGIIRISPLKPTPPLKVRGGGRGYEEGADIPLRVRGKEGVMLDLIDSGAEDIKEEDGGFKVITTPPNLQKLTELIANKGLTIEHSGLEWVPKNTVKITDPSMRGQLDNLYEALDADDDIADFSTNESPLP